MSALGRWRASAGLAALALLLGAGCGASASPAGTEASAPHAPTSPASDADELRSAVQILAASGREQHVVGCRAWMSRRTRQLFDALFAAAGTGEAGWRAVCRAHAALGWPADARVERRGRHAVLSGTSPEGTPFSVPFVREGDRWRVDYAASPEADALVEAREALERARPRATP